MQVFFDYFHFSAKFMVYSLDVTRNTEFLKRLFIFLLVIQTRSYMCTLVSRSSRSAFREAPLTNRNVAQREPQRISLS